MTKKKIGEALFLMYKLEIGDNFKVEQLKKQINELIDNNTEIYNVLKKNIYATEKQIIFRLKEIGVEINE